MILVSIVSVIGKKTWVIISIKPGEEVTQDLLYEISLSNHTLLTISSNNRTQADLIGNELSNTRSYQLCFPYPWEPFSVTGGYAGYDIHISFRRKRKELGFCIL